MYIHMSTRTYSPSASHRLIMIVIMIDGRTGDKAVGRKQTGTTAARLFIGTNQRLQVASGVRGDKAHNSDPKKRRRGPIESAANTLTWKGSSTLSWPPDRVPDGNRSTLIYRLEHRALLTHHDGRNLGV